LRFKYSADSGTWHRWPRIDPTIPLTRRYASLLPDLAGAQTKSITVRSPSRGLGDL